MSKTINARIKHKKDSSTNWETNNPVLLENELILVEMNDGEIRIKIGDGISAYSDLPFSYFGADGESIERILKDGLTNGTKTISEDGTVITTVDSLGRRLVKTFTNDFLTSTTILYDAVGAVLGQLVKDISEDGLTIVMTVTDDDGQGITTLDETLDNIITTQENYIGGDVT